MEYITIDGRTSGRVNWMRVALFAEGNPHNNGGQALQIANMLKQEFRDFIFSTNTDGSGKAASYVRALDMLGPVLTRHYPRPVINGSMWCRLPLADIQAIHKWICAERQKGHASAVLAEFESPSYWTKNFCSAAVKAYGEFMAAAHFEDGILAQAAGEKTGKAVAKKMERLIEQTSATDLEKHLHLTGKEGKDKLKAVKQRVNQDLFRKMVLANYNGKCCLTGLNVQDVLRASHISAWATDEANRLNPENGLCLSATYDAAFDRHLISFDEDYRLILSPSLHEYTMNKAFQQQFKALEGQKISLPLHFLPSQEFLAKHRDKMGRVS